MALLANANSHGKSAEPLFPPRQVQTRPAPLDLSRNHTGLRLLQYIRDEAHRFAQHHHHVLRRKAQIEQEVNEGRRLPSVQ